MCRRTTGRPPPARPTGATPAGPPPARASVRSPADVAPTWSRSFRSKGSSDAHITAGLTVTSTAGPRPLHRPRAGPPLDLTEHEHRRYNGAVEWHSAAPASGGRAGYPVTGSAFPGPTDRSVVRIHGGFRRDKIPQLIAFLAAVSGEAWPF